MKPKVKFRSIALPLAVSYAAGLALLSLTTWFAFQTGEKFLVIKSIGSPSYISFKEFAGLGLLVVFAAFATSAISLVVKKLALYIILPSTLVFMIYLTLNIGSSVAFLWLAYIIGNIALIRGRSRMYVLSLGSILFLSQIMNAFTRTGDIKTASWLIAIDVMFAAPIFYAIFKYIPKQNKADLA